MLAGHYATAIIANQKFPKGSLLFYLLVSQSQDLLWFVFHYLGLESTTPNDAFDATLQNMDVNMLYSHDLLPQIVWVVIVYIAGRALFKSNQVALVGVVVLVGHYVLDFFSGHPHYIFGDHTHAFGLGLYETLPYLAILIEALFCIVALWYFFRVESQKGIARNMKNKLSIIGVFFYGIVFMLLIATNSFRELLHLPSFNIGFNTTVPTLLLTYGGMVILLNRFVGKYETSTNHAFIDE